MSVRDTTAYHDLLELARTPGRAVHWRLEGRLLVAGQEVLITAITYHSDRRQFASRYYGDIFVGVKVDLATYRYIVNNQRSLQFELVKAQQSPDGLVNTEVYRYGQVYTAYLCDPVDPAMMAQVDANSRADGSVLQLSGVVEINLQLVEPMIDDLRLEETGGIFRQTTLQTVLKTLLGYTLGETSNPSALQDGEYVGMRGVDIVPLDNTRVYDHIVIPNGTRLTAIPSYLHDQYGLYSSGVGWHINRGWCYLYPLLNTQYFNSRKRTLTVLNVPVSEIPVMERSFLVRSDQIFVFATGESRHVDSGERIQAGQGNGLRLSRASDLLDTYATTQGNKTTFNKAGNVKAFLVDERPSQKANVRHAQSQFTDNPYRDVSPLVQAKGSTVTVNWDRSAPDLLYPGMPVKFLYKENDRLYSLLGTLAAMETYTATSTGSVTDLHYIAKTTLTLHVERRETA